ncbi:hypothetical protein OF83DRAFT_1174711 [Amylostereum chailletii]|nr:hypothetical protein OF83DRAFT_1174711 [Amylostereum chailletii]
MRLAGVLAVATFQAVAFASQASFRVPDLEPKFWDAPPHPDATGNLIFNSVSSLLQRWPNSLHRNGHTIVPATIPAGTLLYHGRTNDSIPTIPEWLAFDFEHSYIFCRASCYVLSAVATRDLRLAYFDGMSAANLFDGSFDTQDVVLWGEPRPDKVWDEKRRIQSLCEWGRPYGLDGFIRMELHFEVMYCDFSDGLEIISRSNLLPKGAGTVWFPPPRDFPERPGGPTPREPDQRPPHKGPGGPGGGRPPRKGPYNFPPPWRDQPTEPPVGWKGSLPGSTVFMEAKIAGSWHDHAPGETRVHVDYSGLVTFYHPSLRSLVDARRGLPRIGHRLTNISRADVSTVMEELDDVFKRVGKQGSGVDWRSVTRVVMDRYAQRLEFLKYTLETFAFPNATAQAASTRAQLLTMLTPYMTTVDVPNSDIIPSANTSWAAPIAERCARSHTSHILPETLTRQERLIRGAVEDTQHEICRRLSLMWTDAFDIEEAKSHRVDQAISSWKMHVRELMAWLNWSVWVKCDPMCGPDEMCTLPVFPFNSDEDAREPTPRCRSRLMPYELRT